MPQVLQLNAFAQFHPLRFPVTHQSLAQRAVATTLQKDQNVFLASRQLRYLCAMALELKQPWKITSGLFSECH